MSPSALTRRAWLASALATPFLASPLAANTPFRRIAPQFIAALAPEGARSGTGAETWGLWADDPGPVGVRLQHVPLLERLGYGPRGWAFDPADWWLDENGLVMYAPRFPMPPGRYWVTDGEANVSLLTVEAADAGGAQAWALSDGKTIADVTHGPCRSARYTPAAGGGGCSPADADASVFPLPPGASPPDVPGCDKVEYAVLIVFGLPVDA